MGRPPGLRPSRGIHVPARRPGLHRRQGLPGEAAVTPSAPWRPWDPAMPCRPGAVDGTCRPGSTASATPTAPALSPAMS